MGVGWDREGGNRVKCILSSKLKRFRFRDIGSRYSNECGYINLIWGNSQGWANWPGLGDC